MPAPDNSGLVRAASTLRSMAPDAWDDFVKAMREHAAAMALQMVSVPPEVLPRAQGMAQHAQEIAMLLPVRRPDLESRAPERQGHTNGDANYHRRANAHRPRPPPGGRSEARPRVRSGG